MQKRVRRGAIVGGNTNGRIIGQKGETDMKLSWIATEKEVPPIGQPVLVTLVTPLGSAVTIGYFRGGNVWHYTWSTPVGIARTKKKGNSPIVTHWMRPPSPESRSSWSLATKKPLPEVGQRVLVLLEGRWITTGGIDINGHFFNSWDTVSRVTHWRNLPISAR